MKKGRIYVKRDTKLLHRVVRRVQRRKRVVRFSGNAAACVAAHLGLSAIKQHRGFNRTFERLIDDFLYDLKSGLIAAGVLNREELKDFSSIEQGCKWGSVARK
jgi:hypothetical protein